MYRGGGIGGRDTTGPASRGRTQRVSGTSIGIALGATALAVSILHIIIEVAT